MLLTSISVDLLLGISLAREEFESKIPKRVNLLLFSILVIGCIEAGGGLMAGLSAYRYFGFDF
jgi:sodium/potassium-transporting ATPase subunit alpha